MSKIMETLLASVSTGKQMEAEAQAVQAAEPAVHLAEQRLTYQEFSQLWDAIKGIDHASHVDSFTLGFRLGVQLTLEGLGPVCPE